jgi:L-serine dehydratase
MRLFDVLGPVMIGPSSSHTAGAVRIGQTARRLLGEAPVEAEIQLHGSFAATGKGHGTDRALVAGLLGMDPADERIPHSFQVAEEEGLSFTFTSADLGEVHPNTARLHLVGASGKELNLQGASVGGGRILITQVDGIAVNFSGEQNTLIVHNEDSPGHVAEVATALAQRKINIATLQLYRSEMGSYAIMVVETDQPVPESLAQWLRSIPGILKITRLNATVE